MLQDCVKTGSRRHGGFSLTELMFVVVIVGILGALVVPSLLNKVRAAKRSEAQSVLMDLAAEQEKFFLINNAYAGSIADLGYSGDQLPKNYTLTVTNEDGGFLLTATAAGPQAADDDCATLSIDQLGRRTATGGDNARDRCWGIN